MLSGVNLMYLRIYQELVLISYYKQMKGKMYWERRGKISNLRTNVLYETLALQPIVILIISFCNQKICISCLNGILWSKDIRKGRKLNIYNALIESSLLYSSETLRLTENNKRRVEATEMDALLISSRI